MHSLQLSYIQGYMLSSTHIYVEKVQFRIYGGKYTHTQPVSRNLKNEKRYSLQSMI